MITEMMTARLKPVQPGRTSLISVLDIGSTKICCVIARLAPRPEGKALKGRTHAAEVIGFGYGASTGIKSGVRPGERVVVRGAYDVQLASAAKGLPAEGHVH